MLPMMQHFHFHFTFGNTVKSIFVCNLIHLIFEFLIQKFSNQNERKLLLYQMTDFAVNP